MTEAKLSRLRTIVPGVSRETFESLLAFEATLIKWNQRINLVGSSTEREIWERHILDSAQLIRLAPGALRWLDLGSGAGFPGLVLGFLLKDRPGGRIDLVESNRKKSGFLQTMVGQFGLPARVHAIRIEAAQVNAIDVVTARALAPLPLLLNLTETWLSRGARGLFHKGREYAGEISDTSHLWTYELLEHRSTLDPDGVILEISTLRRIQG